MTDEQREKIRKTAKSAIKLCKDYPELCTYSITEMMRETAVIMKEHGLFERYERIKNRLNSNDKTSSE